jgi:ParB family transcriptional regulator, chromosome partitioning protein
MADTKSKPKSRLGRGLSSLVSSMPNGPVEREVTPPGYDPATLEVAAIAGPPGPAEIPVDQILPNPHQPRRQFSEASLAELAQSLKVSGLIQPVILRRVGQTYELIAGERRLRAAKLAGFKSIPALIRDVDSLTQAQMALVENIQREDLNPIDRALGYRTLIDQLGLTQAELAGRLGEERSSIANYLRLLDLTPAVQELVRGGGLTLGHAKLLAALTDPAEQQRIALLIQSQDLSVRNVERLLEGQGPDSSRAATPSAAHLADLEKSIARQLGLRAQVRASSKGKGRLVLHYANLDQFDGLMARLGIKVD